jgi:transposase
MEACGSARHWACSLQAQGLAVRLLPPTHVRRYCLRNKTETADCAALLEAQRNPKIHDVRIKSVEQQALQALHRTRSQWMATRTQRINALRGFCRAFGLPIAVGARAGLRAISQLGSEKAPRWHLPRGRPLPSHAADAWRSQRAASGLEGAERGPPLQGAAQWALEVRQRTNANKATCALANKLARICFATLRHQQRFDEDRACKPRD